jgi:hypothetical protein
LKIAAISSFVCNSCPSDDVLLNSIFPTKR